MPTPAQRLLDPSLLARLSGLNLVARAVVEGFLIGLHHSPHRGFSNEFAQYRPYMPGDDVQHIDWKVYGRTDRLYIKQFEEETNLTAHILLDISSSMADQEDGADPVSKLAYGRILAAALAFLLVRQQDAVGLFAFDQKVRTYLPAHPGQGHLENLLVSLDQLKSGEATDLAPPLHQAAEQMRRRGLAILISDLQPHGESWEDQLETWAKALAHLRFNGHEVLAFHLLSYDELHFPFENPTRFVDPETGETLITAPERIREAYLEEMGLFLHRLEQLCGRYGVAYTRLTTDQPLDLALSAYLAKRGNLG